jgi:hypothetical protein
LNAARALSAAGLWGAALTIVILAMSVLLRLGTQIEDGRAVSTLPADLEMWARIAHRIAAMAVALVAALAVVAAARERGALRANVRALACVVGLTLLLAIIGQYTPGYRFDLVTVANVMGGIALTAAFWALRPRAGESDACAWMALAVLLALAALGAGVDAAAMRGERAFGPMHLWAAALFTVLALTAAWRQRARRALAAATVIATLSQAALGLALVGMQGRPIAAAWTHAILACVLALLLVSLSSRPVSLFGPRRPGLSLD